MTACATDSTLELTLSDGVLLDNQGRTGYIVCPPISIKRRTSTLT